MCTHQTGLPPGPGPLLSASPRQRWLALREGDKASERRVPIAGVVALLGHQRFDSRVRSNRVIDRPVAALLIRAERYEIPVLFIGRESRAHLRGRGGVRRV